MRFRAPLFYLLSLFAYPALAAELYNIDFEAPTHQAGQPPSTGAGPSRISTIQFGSPRVVNDQPLLSGNSLEFEGYTSYEQIRLNLGEVTGSIVLDYDVVTANLRDSLFAFTVLLDTPEVRTLDFHGPLKQIRVFQPGGGGSLGDYQHNRKYHIQVSADVAANQWTIRVDGTQLYQSALNATSFSAIRFSISPAYAMAASDPAIKAWVDNIKVQHSELPLLVSAFQAAEVGSRNAKLSAGINTQGRATTVQFSYTGPDGVSITKPAQTLAAQPNATTASILIENLAPHAAYTARVVATNSFGTKSLDAAFNTLNSVPVALTDEFHSQSATNPFSLPVLLNDTDPDGDTLTVTLPSPGEVGYDPRVSTDGTTVTFQPDGNFNGNATFGYRVSDGFEGAASATVTVSNAAPIANHAALLLDHGAKTGSITLPAEDPDQDPITVVEVGTPSHGEVTLVDGVFTYQAGISFVGFDQFTYVVSDGRGGKVTGSIRVLPSTVEQKFWHGSGGFIEEGSEWQWKLFGIPSVNALNSFGWKARVFKNSEQYDGVFTGMVHRAELRFRTGMPATDENGTALVDTNITELDEPVFAGNNFAFRGRTSGKGSGRKTGMWAQDNGTLRLLAREGDEAPGTQRDRYRLLKSLLMPAGDLVFFTAELTSGKQGLWAWRPSSGVTKLLQEGHDLQDSETAELFDRVISFRALSNVDGSPGHGRYDSARATLDVLVTLAKGRRAIITVRADGWVKVIRHTEDEPSNGSIFTAFGPPSSPGNGRLPVAAVTYRRIWEQTVSRGIADLETGTLLARAGSYAPQTGLARFQAFCDPVAGLDANGNSTVAFQASLTGCGKHENSGIWWIQNSGEKSLLARKGRPAPGTDNQVFGEFQSYAISNGYGPVFTASLLPGSGRGCWATDSAGELRLALKTGDIIDDRTIHSFDILTTVRASEGQRRSWAETPYFNLLTFRVYFKDHTDGIVTVTVP